MEIRAVSSGQTQRFSLRIAQEVVKSAAAVIVDQIARKQRADFRENPKILLADLANRNTTATIVQDIESADARTKLVFKKLFNEVVASVQVNSTRLVQMLGGVKSGMDCTSELGKLISSFVFPKVASVIDQLGGRNFRTSEHPEFWRTENV